MELPLGRVPTKGANTFSLQKLVPASGCLVTAAISGLEGTRHISGGNVRTVGSSTCSQGGAFGLSAAVVMGPAHAKPPAHLGVPAATVPLVHPLAVCMYRAVCVMPAHFLKPQGSFEAQAFASETAQLPSVWGVAPRLCQHWPNRPTA